MHDTSDISQFAIIMNIIRIVMHISPIIRIVPDVRFCIIPDISYLDGQSLRTMSQARPCIMVCFSLALPHGKLIVMAAPPHHTPCRSLSSSRTAQGKTLHCNPSSAPYHRYIRLRPRSNLMSRNSHILPAIRLAIQRTLKLAAIIAGEDYVA
jgi:hypothetical protein